ncbi:MAG: S8 family serine peptidase [Thermoleophilia bacterium]|nr:S8 family serine peptidase [Thermoleophilia bacterium]MDH4340645.1 S8 family serine peptidase [Thermoleophilia bacterium]
MRHHDVGRRGPKGPVGETRGNALWGGKGSLSLTLAVLVVGALALGGGQVQAAESPKVDAYLSAGLLEEAEASPSALFDVIVQARTGKKTDDVAAEVTKVQKEEPSKGSKLKRKFISIAGASATLTGKQLLKLANRSEIESITRDVEVELLAYSNSQLWPQAAGVAEDWSSTAPESAYPAIAVVDSGIGNILGGLNGASGSRLVKSVSMVSGSTSSAYYGHGSMVASIAANQNDGYTGAAPKAKIVSVKVLDGNGVGMKSDIVAACDWILQNKAAYNIRVANFSLNAGGESIRFDALNKAVEALWLNDIVVVVAAGNYAVNGAQSDVGYAPANDPFVITVGASDINNSVSRSDDFAAPWSAYGYTQDGFRKPEVAAPGRYMNGSVPSGATLLTQFPQRILEPNYMWMSGTSFAAPVVSGIAASIIAKNPTWSPDQIKGAIMLKAVSPTGYATNGALGVGVVNGSASTSTSGLANPNAGLRQFVSVNSATGRPEFNANAWYWTALSNASWNSASWSSASWSSASWSSASWSSASWSSASWSSASWASASWANASWANATNVE